MDPLIYLHLAFTSDSQSDLSLQPAYNWNKLSSLAYLWLVPLLLTLTFFGFTESTQAQTCNISQYPKEGDCGTLVTAIQTRLKELGYFRTNLTDYFGPVTRDALIQFQQDMGITPTGQAGALTLGYLFNNRPNIIPRPVQPLWNPLPSVAPLVPGAGAGPRPPAAPLVPGAGAGPRPPASQLYFGRGDSDPAIAAFKQRLQQLGFYWGPINNFFDETTYQAVTNFQIAHQITPQGIMGPTTQKYLYSPRADAFSNLLKQAMQLFQLRRGAQGPLVVQLQTWLRELGYNPGNIDGVYGAQTATALLRFQQQLLETWKQASTQAYSYSVSSSNYTTLPSGTPVPNSTTFDPQVLSWQQRLQALSLYSGPLDGTYNIQTRIAVARAQLRYGISVNDIINSP